MKLLDRICAWILLVGGLMHGVGSWLGYRHEPVTLLWAWSASVLAVVLACINMLRMARRGDRALAWICLCGSAAWAVLAFTFGILIHHPLDPRPLSHTIVSVVLALFSAKALLDKNA